MYQGTQAHFGVYGYQRGEYSSNISGVFRIDCIIELLNSEPAVFSNII